MRHVEYWIADDGEEFGNETDCIMHERLNEWDGKLPFVSDCEFNGSYEDLYNNVNNIEITDGKAFKKFADVMYDLFGFYYPENVSTGDKYRYGDSFHMWKKEA